MQEMVRSTVCGDWRTVGSELSVCGSHPEVIYMLLIVGVKWYLLWEVYILTIDNLTNMQVCPFNCFLYPIELWSSYSLVELLRSL